MITRISCLVYPHILSKFFARMGDVIASKRFCFMSGNIDVDVYMEYPFCIYGHKHIRCGNFFLVPDCVWNMGMFQT